MGGDCEVSWGEIAGVSADDPGTDGGVALRGVASFRFLAADGEGMACTGTVLASVSRGVGAGGAARRSGGEGTFFITFFAKIVGAGDVDAWAGLGRTG